MILMLIPALWILALSMVSVLCIAARRGDVEQFAQSSDSCPSNARGSRQGTAKGGAPHPPNAERPSELARAGAVAA